VWDVVIFYVNLVTETHAEPKNYRNVAITVPGRAIPSVVTYCSHITFLSFTESNTIFLLLHFTVQKCYLVYVLGCLQNNIILV